VRDRSSAFETEIGRSLRGGRAGDGALSFSLAGLLDRLRGRPCAGSEVGPEEGRWGESFVAALAGHLRYAEETLFPALEEVGPGLAGDLEAWKQEHRVLHLNTRDLAARIREGDGERTRGAARSLLALTLEHLRTEAEGVDRIVRSLREPDVRQLSRALRPPPRCSAPDYEVDMDDTLLRYPKPIAGSLTLRPMRVSDEEALLAFFRRIPVDERQLFKDDVTRIAAIRGWVRNLDYSNILPLLALEGSRVVADATLHRDRRGWSRHVARIRVTLDPEYRRRGLARLLVQEFIDLAGPLQIGILQAEILDVQKNARRLFEDLGFQGVATLAQHAIDLTGRVHDVLIYTLTTIPPERLAPEARWQEADADVGGG
jgi:RimJ/RimL family protein N-acetyltransferase